MNPDPGQHPGRPADPLVAADFGGWFDRWFRVFRRSFWRLSLVALIVGAVLAVVIAAAIALVFVIVGSKGPTDPAGHPVAAFVIAFFIVVAIAAFIAWATVMAGQAASIHLAVMDAAGRRVTIRAALRSGVRRALPLSGWSLLVAVIVPVGFLVLIVPGVYLAVALNASFACVVVVERTGVTRCFELIQNRFWATCGRLLLGWALIQTYQLAAQFALAISFAAASTLNGSAAHPGPGVATAILMYPLVAAGLALVVLPGFVASTAITVVTYAELRGHENRYTTTQGLADELAGA